MAVIVQMTPMRAAMLAVVTSIMRTRLFRTALCAAALLSLAPAVAHAQASVVRVAGAPTAGLPVKDAADALRKDQKLDVQLSTDGGSSSMGVSLLGMNLADVALCVRPVTAEDRAQFPGITLMPIQYGQEAASLVVSQDVWDGGVHSITKEQAKAIYDGKITNWKELGGPDLVIVGYTPEQGRGVWACYITWIYDDLSKLRPNRFALTDSDEQAKACLETTPGAITVVATPYAEDNRLHELAIKGDDGKIVEPTAANIAAHTYPMTRPLMLVVKNRPLGDVKTLVDYMLGAHGQEFVRKWNFLTLKDLNIVPPNYE